MLHCPCAGGRTARVISSFEISSAFTRVMDRNEVYPALMHSAFEIVRDLCRATGVPDRLRCTNSPHTLSSCWIFHGSRWLKISFHVCCLSPLEDSEPGIFVRFGKLLPIRSGHEESPSSPSECLRIARELRG